MIKGTIFNIQKYSIHDGPGTRTTVFLKGCPLNCWWCHNPESQKKNAEIMFFKDKCVLCGECVQACRNGALEIKDEKLLFNEDKCSVCGRCADFCLKGARELLGKEITVQELMKEIIKDLIFYEQSHGGVTLSGGEPLVQIDFLEQILKACKKEEIHTTVDTCAYAPWKSFERILDSTDLFLLDLKHIDSEMHKKYTGVPNELILQNIKKLSDLGKNIFIRMPIIPGVNDDKDTIQKTIKFISSLNVAQVNLLPYHKVGMDKYKRLQKDYKLMNLEEPTSEMMSELSEQFKKSGLNVKIGG